jgi:lipoprotein NlpI
MTTNVNYARLYRFACLLRLHRDEKPQLKSRITRWSESWTKSIGRYLTGELTSDSLLAMAAQGGGRTGGSRLCEAHYFVGAMLLAAGNTAEARDHFERCVATKEISYSAFGIARAELARLSGKP